MTEQRLGVPYRVRRYVNKYGAKAAAARALGEISQRIVLDETHIWYELPLDARRPSLQLAPGLTLVQAGPERAHLIEGLPTVSLAEATRRLQAGNDLWFGLDGETPAFACWIFHRTMPVLAAPGETLRLPASIVCLEDSVTSIDYRGRGVAAAAWTMIAETLHGQGVHSMITKVGEDNKASRRAVEKAGFVEVGAMHFRRVGPRKTSSLSHPSGVAGPVLAEQLNR